MRRKDLEETYEAWKVKLGFVVGFSAYLKFMREGGSPLIFRVFIKFPNRRPSVQ